MRSEIRVQPVFQRILYSQSWEDPLVDLAALEIGPQDDVLAIAASGDNVLGLLTANPRSMTGIDFSLTQICLVELKMAGFKALSYDELLGFLGVDPLTAAERRALYPRLRPHLSETARGYWDGEPGLIGRGVIHIGRFENYFRIFRSYVLPLVHDRGTINRFLALESLEEQRHFYDNIWNSAVWRGLFKVFFGKTLLGKLGRDPAFFKYVDVASVGATFLERARHCFCGIPVRSNAFAEYILRGNYASRDRLPLYLEERHFELLRDNVDRVRLVNDAIEGLLPDCDGAFSKFYLSDIFEWMSAEAYEELLRAFVKAGRPGGKMVYRNLLVPREHPSAVDDLLENDPARAAELLPTERSFVWGRLEIETIKG